MRASEQKLLEMLSNNDVTFYIPPYQRNYEWTSDQCDTFFDDIVKTCDRNKGGSPSEHFFGTVTYFQVESTFGQPRKIVLIDGQQRITTTMLFLVAARDVVSDNDLQNFIYSSYLRNNKVSGDEEYKIKLKQVETDWGAFRDIILGRDLPDNEKNAAVYKNYKYFVNRLSSYQKSGGDPVQLINDGLNKFSVVTIELYPQRNQWENPQEIFESMNSLGKPLSLADLVRNYLLMGLDTQTQETLYNRYWLNIERILPERISDYIRDYMQYCSCSSLKKATESNYKELYGIFKNMFDDEGKSAESILHDLSEYALTYSYILRGGNTGNHDIDYELADINTLQVTTAYSLLFGLLIKWKDGSFFDRDIVDILDAFRIYCIRRRLVTLAAGENKNLPQLVSRIPELIESGDKRKKMFEILADQESSLRLPNDIEVSRYLETVNFYNFQYCKFVLSLIEENITKSRPDTSDKNLQIEHIMPQTLNDIWRTELGPDYETVHQELVNTIGNLTLIRHNQELGNKSFEEKKKIYENNSGLQIAKNGIINCSKWDKETILERTKYLINYLLEVVLPVPDSMRKNNNFSIKEHRGLSFRTMGLVRKDIDFIADPSIVARVISDSEVIFEGKKWRLLPLTREIQTRRGTVSVSSIYQCAQYWEYSGTKLADMI